MKVLVIFVLESIPLVFVKSAHEDDPDISKDPIQICAMIFLQLSAGIMRCDCWLQYLQFSSCNVCSDPLGPGRPGFHANHWPLKETL